MASIPAFSRDAEFDALIAPLAEKSKVPVALVKGVIATESGFNPNATNITGPDGARGGSYGLMQMSLKTARGMGYTGSAIGLLDPPTNLRLGIEFLGWCYHGDAAAAAAEYNGGHRLDGATAKYSDQSYVDSVGKWMAHYSPPASPVVAARVPTPPVVPAISQTTTSDVRASMGSVIFAIVLAAVIIGLIAIFSHR